MSNNCPWKIIKEEIYESFPIMTLKKSTRVNPVSNAQIDFVRIEGLDWVNVLAFTENDELIMVKQYRHGSEEYTLEFPGGCIEKEERDPGQGALRELLEETGYRAESCQYLGMLRPNPAMYAMRNFFYVARSCKLSRKQQLDAGEDIQVVLKPYSELLAEVKRGSFTHGMCVAGLTLYNLSKLGS